MLCLITIAATCVCPSRAKFRFFVNFIFFSFEIYNQHTYTPHRAYCVHITYHSRLCVCVRRRQSFEYYLKQMLARTHAPAPE